MLYQTMQEHHLKHGEFQIVWLDGHAKGALDDAWKLIFTPNIAFVKELSGCHNPVYFPADGSKADIHDGCPRGAEKGAGFATFILNQMGLLGLQLQRCASLLG